VIDAAGEDSPLHVSCVGASVSIKYGFAVLHAQRKSPELTFGGDHCRWGGFAFACLLCWGQCLHQIWLCGPAWTTEKPRTDIWGDRCRWGGFAFACLLCWGQCLHQIWLCGPACTTENPITDIWGDRCRWGGFAFACLLCWGQCLHQVWLYGPAFSRGESQN